MKEKLIKLIDLKSIITIILTLAAVYGFVTKLIGVELFASWVSMALAFYFSRKENK